MAIPLGQQPAYTDAPRKAPAVGVALAELGEALALLDSAVDDLARDLAHVTTPRPTAVAVAGTRTPEPPCSPVMHSVREHILAARALRERVNSLRESLD